MCEEIFSNPANRNIIQIMFMGSGLLQTNAMYMNGRTHETMFTYRTTNGTTARRAGADFENDDYWTR